jgi:hypothetical protein
MAMKNVRDLFAQTDQQVSLLKERIVRQRDVIKRAKLRGHSTAAAETIQHTLHQSLRAFEKWRQQIFERMEARRAAEGLREGEVALMAPLAKAPAAQFEVSIDARPRSYRDRKAVAIEAAEHLKREIQTATSL